MDREIFINELNGVLTEFKIWLEKGIEGVGWGMGGLRSSMGSWRESW